MKVGKIFIRKNKRESITVRPSPKPFIIVNNIKNKDNTKVINLIKYFICNLVLSLLYY